MDTLTICDLHGLGRDELISHIVKEYDAKREDVERFDFLVAYESVGNWGCDSSSWFLLRDKGTGELYEVSGSHCSCYGFEGQWEPSATTLGYLQSEHFKFYTGGYDDDAKEHAATVKSFVMGLRS